MKWLRWNHLHVSTVDVAYLSVRSRSFHLDLQKCHSSMIRKVLKNGMVWSVLNVEAAVIYVLQNVR